MSIYFKRIFLIIINDCENFVRSLFWMLNFEEWMAMAWSHFTIFTQIKISTNRAFVSDSFNAMLSTFITSNSFMYNFRNVRADRRLLKKRLLNFFHKLWHQFLEFFLNVSFSYLTDLTGVYLRMFESEKILLMIWLFLLNNLRLIILFFKRFITFRNRSDFIIIFNLSLFWAVLK